MSMRHFNNYENDKEYITKHLTFCKKKFEQYKDALAPIFATGHTIDEVLNITVKTDWNEPLCKALDNLYAYNNGIKDAEKELEELEKDNKEGLI